MGKLGSVARRPGSAGFTLIEAMVVVLLASIAMGVFLGYNFSQRDSYRLKSAARQAFGFLRAARTFAVLDARDNVCSFSPETGKLGESLRGKTLSLPEGVSIEAPEDVEEGRAFDLARFYSDGSAQAVAVRLSIGERAVDIEIDPVLGEAKIVKVARQ